LRRDGRRARRDARGRRPLRAEGRGMSDASPTTSMSNAQGRRARARIYLIANALLLTLIVLMVNYLAFRHYKRWDWTEESLFTLSDRSERVLAELKQPVEVWVMVGENEPEHAELRTL